MGTCTLDQAIEMLKEITEKSVINPTDTLLELGVDSLEVLEWSFVVMEELGIDDDLEADAFFDSAKELTVEAVYQMISSQAANSET
jgi:acyl carrier protein